MAEAFMCERYGFVKGCVTDGDLAAQVERPIAEAHPDRGKALARRHSCRDPRDGDGGVVGAMRLISVTSASRAPCAGRAAM
jgi:hypothetical protein